jgi:diguanylate cyclase (GGDEF)-like protein/PAS domain S-box-containing protein
MTEHWPWVALAALAAFATYQQFRVYRIRRESAKREELFQIVTENAADMIALVDVKGNRIYNSPAYKRILGYSAAELGETSAFDQIHSEDRFKVLEAAREARNTGVGQKLEYRIRHKDGTWRVLESVAGTIRDDKGQVAKLVIVNRDITERKRVEEQAEHNSVHDSLTGLPNRRLFLDRLQRLFEHAQRNSEDRYAVLLADLDGFKLFNDAMGPAAGDEVLIEIGRRLAACLREEDTVARPQDDLIMKTAVLSRLGGDEFTILLEGVHDPSDAMRVAQRILVAASQPLQIEGQTLHTSASIGIALSATTQKRAETLLQEADVAMRRAKALGGSRCEVFDEAMHTRAVNRLKLEAELQEAIVQRQFRVHYQPIVDLKTKRIFGFEALLRWLHPQQGLISPYKFLDAAEDTGLLFAAGQWLILQACQQLVGWKTLHPTAATVKISVNLSARQFTDTRFVPGLESALRSTGVEPSHLQLEMTENVAAADPKLTVTALSCLKHIGVGVVVDNFGAGNSSLSALRLFPAEALKIDRTLIEGMLSDRATCDTVDLIITLAHKLKLTAIAEGIETLQQLDRLRELGCDLGQGYLFSQPVDAEAAGEILSASGFLMHAKVAGA